jgi:anti-sigma28 factor (negative regulator of flagellin synthesis)
MDDFACSLMNRVVTMRDFDINGCFEEQDSGAELTSRNPHDDEDLLMEEILENISTTPIGQVLKKIASLPEVRRDKVLEIRQRLTKGQYDLGERLDIALDKVLEDLTK